jgi:hypothetical protein
MMSCNSTEIGERYLEWILNVETQHSLIFVKYQIQDIPKVHPKTKLNGALHDVIISLFE